MHAIANVEGAKLIQLVFKPYIIIEQALGVTISEKAFEVDGSIVYRMQTLKGIFIIIVAAASLIRYSSSQTFDGKSQNYYYCRTREIIMAFSLLFYSLCYQECSFFACHGLILNFFCRHRKKFYEGCGI